jgi:predicted nucleotidyltransferase
MGNTSGYRQLYEKSEDFLKKLLKENLPADSRIFLFGSRAAGGHSRSSDIDIGVISENLDKKVIIKLKEIIDESFVPFKVDIVDFSKVDEDFKQKALRRIVQWK